MSKSIYFEDHGYSGEELERVKRAVEEALRKRRLSYEKIEVYESGGLSDSW